MKLIKFMFLCTFLTTSFTAPTPKPAPVLTCFNGEQQYKNLMNSIASFKVGDQTLKLLNDVDQKVFHSFFFNPFIHDDLCNIFIYSLLKTSNDLRYLFFLFQLFVSSNSIGTLFFLTVYLDSYKLKSVIKKIKFRSLYF